MMFFRRKCFFFLFFLAVFKACLILCQEDFSPTNITIVSQAHSLTVAWQLPENVPMDKIESYRVRLYPTNNEGLKRVQWVPADSPRMETTVSCLNPGTIYKVQVNVRFFIGTNITESKSSLTDALTKSEPKPDFLDMAWEQWRFVCLGAGLAGAIFLLLTACVCSCCRLKCCKKRRGMHVSTQPTNETRLPSAKDLQELERYRAKGENRYSLDPVQSGNALPSRPAGAGTSSTSSRTQLVSNDLPPFLKHGPLSPSFPHNAAPSRPPLPWPKNEDDVFHADDEEVGDELYVNEPFPPSRQAECPVYGNCQF